MTRRTLAAAAAALAAATLPAPAAAAGTYPPGYGCLFHDANYTGAAFCFTVDTLDQNVSYPNLANNDYANGNTVNDTLSSLYIGSPQGPGVSCRLFVWRDANYQGPHHHYTYRTDGGWDYYPGSTVALFNPKTDRHLGDSTYNTGDTMADNVSSLTARCTHNP